MNAETRRLQETERRDKNWERWGPYLAERQWGTVREDYSPGGTCWEEFPHDHARSRVYRWGEDGLLGLTDRECRLCFAVALWNGRDPILKERLFGLTGPEGNHGEDVKESYYYLDATPTFSYAKALYKYPQAEFPYARLVDENRRRGREEPEFELADTGVFDEGRYFDVLVEYAKGGPNDLRIRLTATNRGPDRATVHLLPTIWFRNTWAWGRTGEGYWPRPKIRRTPEGILVAEHAGLGTFFFLASPLAGEGPPRILFTENETNHARLYGVANGAPHVKDAFHEYVVQGRRDAVNAEGGTKAAAHYVLDIPPGESRCVQLWLHAMEEAPNVLNRNAFDGLIDVRAQEADDFYAERIPAGLTDVERQVARQAYAGLLWSRQFFHFVVKDWLEGDPAQPRSPEARKSGRNADWGHLYNRDVISIPDKWEYPWFAAWDLAFHMIPLARVDPASAKDQLVMLLREWFMHPNGQVPAYEFAFGDVNPPVHAWACWRVYKITGPRGKRDRLFLERVFHKLLLNFTWWVNRKDSDGNHLFSGGFLGLDNIGVFDRSQPLPGGGQLEQADGTAWMAFYCATMLSMALELAREDPAYEDVASKFFEHFIDIADAMNRVGGCGLWDEEDGFFYDHLMTEERKTPLRVRSMVGIIPLFAVSILDEAVIARLPGFSKRMKWLLENRRDLFDQISFCSEGATGKRLLSIPSRGRLERVLRRVFDEREFLSPHGVRSLSRHHLLDPYITSCGGHEHRVDYSPGESTTGLFGGNSNWRGPIWFPVNYLLVESLEKYHHFYGDEFRVECPTGSGRRVTLKEAAHEILCRLVSTFLPDGSGRRPCHGDDARYAQDPAWRDLALFYEYFHGDTGRGLGATHQTGWTALVARWLEDVAKGRAAAPK